MAADDSPLRNREAALALARFIREHIDALVETSMRAYRQDYPFSSRGGVDDRSAARWATSEYAAMADQLESGSIDAGQYRGMGGDMVIQHERLLYPIDAFLEWCLFGARVVASAIWRETVGDTRTTTMLLAELEAFTQARMRANTEAFLDEICRPRAIQRTWELRTGPLQVRATPSPDDGMAPALSTQAHAAGSRDADGSDRLFAKLTPHEASMARLVGQGLSNAQVASRMGVSLSTVKNTMSRMYAKLGIGSRVELVMLLSQAGAGDPGDAVGG